MTLLPRRALGALMLLSALASREGAAAAGQIPGTAAPTGGVSWTDLFLSWSWQAQEYDRWAIRRHIAAQVPDTPFGVAARGWLAGVAGKEEEALSLFRKAVRFRETEVYAAYWLTQNQYIAQLAPDELRQIAEIADHQTRAQLPTASLFRNLFLDRASRQADPEGALRQADKWAARTRLPHLRDALLGAREQYQRKNPAAAVEAYERALAATPQDLDTADALVRLLVFTLADPAEPHQKRYEPVNRLIEQGTRLRRSGDALARKDAAVWIAHAAAIVADDLPVHAASYYAEGFKTWPSGVLAIGYVDSQFASYKNRPKSADDFERPLLRYLEDAARVLPNHPELIANWGGELSKFDKTAAEELFRRASALPAPDDMKARIVFDQGWHYSAWGEHDRAVALYDQNVTLHNDMRYNAYVSSLAARRFEDASRRLDDYRASLASPNAGWFHQERTLLASTIHQLEMAREEYRTTPLWQQWSENLGQSLVLRIGFGARSDTLDADAGKALAQVASLLNDAGGNDVLVSVEGHTDGLEASGGDARALSLRRAEVVAKVLVDQLGVPVERLSVRAFADEAQISGNDTEKGRRLNRRVEIAPEGRSATASVVTNTAINTKSSALSPDGRLLALGVSPVELWDPRRGIKLRELRTGGTYMFSPTGRYLAMASNYQRPGGVQINEVVIIDARSGGVIEILPAPQRGKPIYALAWNRSGTSLGFGCSIGSLSVYDIRTRIVRTTRLPGPPDVRVLTWLPDSSAIVVGCAWSTRLQVFDAQRLELVGELSGTEYPHGLAISGDGRYLACVDNETSTHNRAFSVWNTADLFREPRQVLAPFAGEIGPGPFGAAILMAEKFGSEKHRVVRFDLETMQSQAEISLNNQVSVAQAFTPDGGLTCWAAGGVVELRDGTSLQLRRQFGGTGLDVKNCFVDDQNGRVLVSTEDGISVLDLRTGRRVHIWSGLNLRDRFAETQDQFLAVRGELNDPAQSWFRVETTNFTRQDLPIGRINFAVTAQRARGERLMLAGVPFASPEALVDDQGFLELYDLGTGRSVARATVQIRSHQGAWPKITKPAITSVDMTADGKAVYATAWTDGYRSGDQRSRVARVVDLPSGQIVQRIEVSDDIEWLNLRDDDRRLEVNHLSAFGLRDLASGDPVGDDDYSLGFGRYRAPLDGKTGYLNWDDTRLTLTSPDGKAVDFLLNDNLQGVEVAARHGLVIVVTRQGEIRFLKFSTLEQLMQVTFQAGGRWIALTPDGYFAAAEGGTDGVRWTVGSIVLDMQSVRDRYERPGILAERLGRAREGIGNETALSPVASLASPPASLVLGLPVRFIQLSPAHVRSEQRTFVMRLRVEKLSRDVPDPAIRFSVNGQDLADSIGRITLRTDTRIEIEREFTLSEGRNIFEASLGYGPYIVLPVKATVIYAAPQKSRPSTRLYYVGCGVTTYKKETLNGLKFPARDAEELAKALQRQEGLLYTQVKTLKLSNEDATEQNVKKSIYDFLEDATELDTIILFFAGHGIQDLDQDLYFLTYDGDPDHPDAAGLDFTWVQKLLRRRPPRQKALVLLDICHAGAFKPFGQRDPATPDDVIKRLHDGTGVVVFAACKGRETAIEREDFEGGHGAFTAAILEALEGKAPNLAGGNVITVQGLSKYVSDRVRQMTNGHQNPITPVAENFDDFPLASLA